jgi:transposase
MRFYNNLHQYYCGIDLHTRTMYVCILDQQGHKLQHKNISCSPENLLEVIKPFLPDVVISVECMFTWYWIADFCEREKIPFVLGHALYMRAIHGGKTKSDKIDSYKIAGLLRSGMFPMAYVYPQEMRATRDLLRRRMHFMRKKSELLGHIQNTKSQYNLPDFEKAITRKNNRKEVAEHFSDLIVRRSIELNLALINQYDYVLKGVENYILSKVRAHDPNTFYLLRTIPGVGEILGLVMLYEIHDIKRFPRVQNFTSYARLVKPVRESAGKQKGGGNKKMGNAYLKWAFSEATLLLLRERQQVKQWHAKLKNRHGKARALSIISHKLGRAVYYMLNQHKVFDLQKFIGEK